MDRGKLIWLWLIRENQPVSFRELLQRIMDETADIPAPPALLEDFYFSVRRRSLNDVMELINLGLVTTESDQPFDVHAKLLKTSKLDRIQDIFAISLRQMLKQTDSSLSVDPLFGRPAPVPGDWARIFVAMPFADHMRHIYTDHILKVAARLAVTCKRGDDFFTANSIVHDVWSAIYHAELCIADCTRRNPNVFYELGIAHTLGRKVVLIAQTVEDVPFDVGHLRTIIYQESADRWQAFEATLEKTIRTELGINNRR